MGVFNIFVFEGFIRRGFCFVEEWVGCFDMVIYFRCIIFIGFCGGFGFWLF